MTTMCSGDRTSLFVDVDDRLWICGSDVFGSNTRINTPSVVEGLPPLQSVSAFGFVLLLDVEGYVWQVQGGVPTKLENLPQIKTISTGHKHAMLLDVNNQVWGMGGNAHGQLGIKLPIDRNNHCTIKVEDIASIESICASFNHSLLLDVEGRVWGSGSNGDCRLGMDSSTTTPKVIDIDIPIQSLSSGWVHSLFIDVNNTLHTCGGNQTLQQGLENIVKVEKVTKHATLPEIRLAFGGYYHSLFVDTKDSVWACGGNSAGQLGIPPVLKSPLQQVAAFDNIPPIASISSLYHSLFLDVEGDVWACGKNDCGQLGLGTVESTMHTPTKIESLPRIKNASKFQNSRFRAKSARNI